MKQANHIHFSHVQQRSLILVHSFLTSTESTTEAKALIKATFLVNATW